MKTNNQNEFTPEQKAFGRDIVLAPVRFAEHILGVTLQDYQAEIIRSIKKHRNTAIKAAHAVGKTFTLGGGGVVVARALPRRHRSHYLSYP